MAAYTNLGQFQKHLEIDYLETGDEAYLQLLLDASESRIEKEINQPFTEFVDADGKLDPSLVAAILIFGGTLYANREAVAYADVKPVPFTLKFLIQPYIKYT
ncbi:head-tail connector protein [Dysgonomonas sp. GY617]|uniref:head-tail connector protein n=1 Tax=Dysgonomonas sp. GY617 TaxID=2780420 RepID=UPI0018839CC9|nr:head-tail connector protein [Dysgonomonas sp. GY617]MBF0577735.1 phage gp6-like head-tail connector protein [Dysgonomonas sp. GY617]